MNAGRMYVPNYENVLKYYQGVAEGKNDAYLTHMKSGGKNGTFMIPIQCTPTNLPNDKCDPVKFKLVSPSAQMVDMAKETLKEEGVSIKKEKRKRKSDHKPSGSKRKKTCQKYKSSGAGKKKRKDIFSS